MDYEIVRGLKDCGIVTYDVTGSYDSSSSSFSLSATVHGSGYDGCGYPVPFTQQTETVTLSGRACGTGSAQFDNTTSGSGSTAQIGMALIRSIPSLPSQRKKDDHGSQVATGESRAIASPPASIANLRPLDAQGSSSWTTISPRFTVQYSSYIPVDHIAGPTPCLATGGTTAHGWLTYKGDAFRGTYRTTNSLLVVPGAQKYGNQFARGGPTRNYQIPSSPANGLGANLSSTPTGDPWNAPYTGADEDERSYDCRLWNAKGEDTNSGLGGVGVTFGNPITQVNVHGLGQNPLEVNPPGEGVKWNLTISLDTTDPAHPKAWVSGGTATCYPAHIVKVNGTPVFEQRPTQNNTVYLGLCLFASGQPVVPSAPTVVPAH